MTTLLIDRKRGNVNRNDRQKSEHKKTMSSFKDVFRSTKNRKSIPKSWCGLWTDKNGKQVTIQPTGSGSYSVTVLDKYDNSFQIDLLGDKKRETKNLLGQFTKEANGNPILQVEAGNNGVGPTYNLCFLTSGNNEKLRLAKNSDSLSKIIIKPDVGMGLYDDWEVDLGVSWAYPLEDFKKKD